MIATSYSLVFIIIVLVVLSILSSPYNRVYYSSCITHYMVLSMSYDNDIKQLISCYIVFVLLIMSRN